jgi:hypothetical protein
MSTGVDAVVAVLARRQWRYRCEDDLQEAVADILAANGHIAFREVSLGRPYGRIDVLSGRVGIEVKVDGSVPAVIRQLAGYARSGRIDALVLVTSRAIHRRVPPVIGGIPVRVVVATAGL